MIQIFEKYNNIFFVGIGGVSMSALAVFCKSKGVNVCGSDNSHSEIILGLKRKGIKVYSKHKGRNIIGCNLVVFSGAISQDNPELVEAYKQNIPIMERSEFLGKICEGYKNVIAVAGTHGKTTTTSMIAHIFMVAGLNPTVHIGGYQSQIGGNLHIGSNEYFITEACEFRDSFLQLKPTVSVITNIEFEHVDYFGSLERENKSFNNFVNATKKESFASFSCKKNITPRGRKVHFVGAKTGLNAQNITLCDDGKYSFDLYCKKDYICNLKLNVYGKYNIQNALLAIAVARRFGIDINIIQLAIRTYEPVHRRFEQLGFFASNIVVQDYAHHPTEISATLTAAGNYPHKRLVCIFQPHTYTRTKAFLDDFAKALSLADLVILTDIYAAREKNTIGISSGDLKNKLDALGKECYYFPLFDDIENFILENCSDGDLLITMGAGDVVKIGESLLGK